jgi:hypothetical protein
MQYCKYLSRKSFIEFDEIHIVEVETSAGEELPNCRHRSNAHCGRFTANGGPVDQESHWLKAQRREPILSHNQACCGGIILLA